MRHLTLATLCIALALSACADPTDTSEDAPPSTNQDRRDVSAQPDASHGDVAIEDCSDSVSCEAPCQRMTGADLTAASADCKGPERQVCVKPQAANSVCVVMHRTDPAGESEVLFLPEALTLEGWTACNITNSELAECACAEILGCLI